MLLKELKIIHELDDTPFQRGVGALKSALGLTGSDDGRVRSKDNVDPAMLSLIMKIVDHAATSSDIEEAEVKRLIPAGRTSADAVVELKNAQRLLNDSLVEFAKKLGELRNIETIGYGDSAGLVVWFKNQRDPEKEKFFKAFQKPIEEKIKQHNTVITKMLMGRQASYAIVNDMVEHIDKALNVEVDGVLKEPTPEGIEATKKFIGTFIGLVYALDKSLEKVGGLLTAQKAPDASA